MKTDIVKAVFVAMLVLANILATKIMVIPFGVNGVTVTAGVIPIAIAYLCSDVLAETIGKKETKRWVTATVITVAFSWVVIFTAVNAPVAQSWGGQAEFSSVLSASYPVVTASLITFLVSQHFDVALFHKILSRTGRDHKWLRNIGSTVTTQLFDTAGFTLLAFAVLPTFIGGTTLPLVVIGEIVLIEYAVKVGIAMIDTPLFYAFTYDYERSG